MANLELFTYSSLHQVTPFPAPGSAAAIAGRLSILRNRLLLFNLLTFSDLFTEASSGVFRPILPFGALSSIPSNAIYFGSILGFQRLCCKSMELVRRREDIGNDLFGFAMIWPYYHYFLNHSEMRLIRHNRLVGGSFVLCIIYANFLA
jgi:hypothetical protein